MKILKNIYIKDRAELSSLERTAEEKSMAEPTTESSALARSSLERTKLYKSFKILIIL